MPVISWKCLLYHSNKKSCQDHKWCKALVISYANDIIGNFIWNLQRHHTWIGDTIKVVNWWHYITILNIWYVLHLWCQGLVISYVNDIIGKSYEIYNDIIQHSPSSMISRACDIIMQMISSEQKAHNIGYDIIYPLITFCVDSTLDTLSFPFALLRWKKWFICQ